MLQPMRTRYRKAHKGRIHCQAKGGTTLNFGSFGLKAVEPERLTARQGELLATLPRAAAGELPALRRLESRGLVAIAPRPSRPRCAWARAKVHRSCG